MSLMLQSKVLRAIQEKKIERVGGTQTIRSDVKIIVATNQNLEKMVQENRFRRDLFFRVNVLNIDVLPLRERKDEIPMLTHSFIDKFSRQENKKCKLSQEVIKILMDYDWPGNVRELMNVMKAAVVTCNSKYIEMRQLPAYFLSSDSTNRMQTQKHSLNLGTSIMEIEREYIVKALKYTANNKSKAMKILGISRSAFYEKLKKYHIE